MKNSTCYLILFCAVFFLSTSAIFVKLAGAPSAVTAFYRLFFAGLILVPPLLFSRKNRREIRSLSGKHWILAVLSGLLLAVHYMLWFESLNYTSVASSTVLVTLQPVFSFAGGYFLFRERYGKKAVAGCLIAIAGSVLIGWGDFQVSLAALAGDVMAFVAAGFIAGYFMLGQHVRSKLSVLSYSSIGYFSSAFFLLLFALFQKAPLTGYPAKTWWSFLGLAFVSTILGQMSFNWLLKWLKASVISMSILGEAVGTCILGYFILGEQITRKQGLGILVILAGLALFLRQPSSGATSNPNNTEVST